MFHLKMHDVFSSPVVILILMPGLHWLSERVMVSHSIETGPWAHCSSSTHFHTLSYFNLVCNILVTKTIPFNNFQLHKTVTKLPTKSIIYKQFPWASFKVATCTPLTDVYLEIFLVLCFWKLILPWVKQEIGYFSIILQHTGTFDQALTDVTDISTFGRTKWPCPHFFWSIVVEHGDHIIQEAPVLGHTIDIGQWVQE